MDEILGKEIIKETLSYFRSYYAKTPRDKILITEWVNPPRPLLLTWAGRYFESTPPLSNLFHYLSTYHPQYQLSRADEYRYENHFRKLTKELRDAPDSACFADMVQQIVMKRTGSTTVSAYIDPPFVNHHFAVVDYWPDAASPKCVQDIALDPRCRSAWVIDPWMNIVCRFDEYPQSAKIKLRKWHDKGKHILRREYPESVEPYDPTDDKFHSRFFLGDLKFFDLREPTLSPDRFEKAKSARSNT